jgi:hypothetical protein
VELVRQAALLYAGYFAAVVLGGAVLGTAGWLAYCLITWCGRRFRPRG